MLERILVGGGEKERSVPSNFACEKIYTVERIDFRYNKIPKSRYFHNFHVLFISIGKLLSVKISARLRSRRV